MIVYEIIINIICIQIDIIYSTKMAKLSIWELVWGLLYIHPHASIKGVLLRSVANLSV